MTTRRPLLVLFAVLAALGLVAAACGDDDDTSTTATTAAGDTSPTTANAEGSVPDGPEIKIGAQDFGESAILAEIYSQALTAGGYKASINTLGGYRDLELAAFDSGDINFAPEYAASMLEQLNKEKSEATGDAAATTELLQGYLEPLGLQALTPTEAVDTNGFVVTKDTADELGIATLSDLADKGAELKLGGPTDCETNPFCIPGLEKTYGVDLSGNFTPLEAGNVTVTALENSAIDVAVLFSTNGTIADKGWVLLKDDKHMLAADNVVPVVSAELVEAYGEDFTNKVDAIGAKLTTADLTELNRRFDVDKEDASAIAKSWLEDNGLL